MTDFQVRRAEVGDVDRIYSLFTERGKTDNESNILKRVKVAIHSKENLLAVVEVESKLVGYIWIQNYGPHIRVGGSTARLQDIFVNDEHRRLGLAKALFNFGKEWCKESHVDYLQWQANAEAVQFYESLGLKGDTKSDLEESPFFEIDFTKL